MKKVREFFVSHALGISLVFSSLVSIGLFAMRWQTSGSTRYWFLIWNLVLAWVPLFFAWLLTRELKRKSWLSWQALSLTGLWLGFLPNSFYLLSDFVHLHVSGEASLLFDTALFSSFAFNGLVLGFYSLVIVHRQLMNRLRSLDSHAIIAGVLLLCGYAIYLGRSLRWNTWDVLVNPSGVLFDVSDRFINLPEHPQLFSTTLTFFVLLGSMYTVIWQLSRPKS